VSPALAGSLVVVTGGTGGLGRAAVEELLARGARVVVGELHPPREGAAIAGVDYRSVNAADEASVLAFFEELPQAPLGLVNVIGGWAGGPTVDETDLATLRQQLEVNLVTATLLTKHAVRKMKPAGVGRIVHVSSRAARETGHHAFAYSVSKLGVTRLVEAAAEENRAHGLSVNCVMPTTMDTPANRASMPGANFSRWLKTGDVAKVLAFLVSDDSAAITGAAIPVSGRE
jgi:NAD(P)-dependent dehydrogenase (short-subunit alcohol dehydrogenase family)